MELPVQIELSAKKMPPLKAALQAQIELIRSCSGVPGRTRTRDPLLRRRDQRYYVPERQFRYEFRQKAAGFRREAVIRF